MKGLTPIPYKVVTIFSGVAKLDMLTFISASLLARGFRFFMLAGVLRYAGPSVREFIERNLGLVTTLTLIVIAAGFIAVKYL